jgi:hypothetical protein
MHDYMVCCLLTFVPNVDFVCLSELTCVL